MVNQICRMEPAPLMSASVTVDPFFTSTQSALPPERSALEARLETASLRLTSPSRGLFCCPRANAEKHTRKLTILIMAILLQNCGRNLITGPECDVAAEVRARRAFGKTCRPALPLKLLDLMQGAVLRGSD